MFISSRINVSWVLLSTATIDILNVWMRGHRRKAEFMFLDGFCCKLTKSNASQLTQQNVECTAATGLKIVYSLPAPQIMSQFSQQMKQRIDKKITKSWRWSIFRQLPLLFVLMVEIGQSLFFWLAKKKCSSELGDTYVCIRNDTANVPFQPDMESHLKWTLADFSNIMVLRRR